MIDRRKFMQSTGAAALTALATPTWGVERLPTRLIPGTGESLPIVGLGNSRAFAAADSSAASSVLDTFLQYGGGYVDLSGSSRFTVGKIVADHSAQEKTFFGNYLNGQNLDEMRAEIRQLQSVQGDGPIDLSMKRDVADLGLRAAEFSVLKKEGLLRYVGIGRPHQRFYPAMMQLMNDGVVDFIQVNYSMMEPEAANEILPLAIERNIAVVINRPFMNGDYFGMVKGHELPAWAAEFDCESWAQFSLKYILSNPAVNCVLTETSNPRHLLDNLGAAFGAMPDATTRQRMYAHMLQLRQ
jgi:predicted aldo/keto reductase-like oxidoreductase